MAYHNPQHIARLAIEAGTKKVHLPFLSVLLLGFLGGAFISIGYLADIRVIASLPHEWGSFSAFLGAAVFPVGLMLIIVA